MKYVLSFREKSTGGAVVPGQLLEGPGLGSLAELQAEPRLTFLLHGYNVNFQKGKGELLRLADSLSAAVAGGVVATLWPGDHWIGFLSYSVEGRDADDSAAMLARFIGDAVADKVPLCFAGHSLGNRVAMETVNLLLDNGHETLQMCLMAAAIDDFSLASPNDYFDATNDVGRVAVLWSKKDKVLKWAYPAGDLLESFLFWDESKGFALGYNGPKPDQETGTAVPANVVDVRIPDHREAGHRDYLPPMEDKPNAEQKSAASFANAVLVGDPSPVYPPADDPPP